MSVYDAGVLVDGRPYLIMELCPGGSLSQWLTPENRLSEEQVRRIGVRIADALDAAHTSGVLHRDIKPATILIDSQGDPRLADFGFAAVAGAEESVAEVLPTTPAYAPPEAFGMQPATEASDVFSLAATLYALLACRPPRNVDLRTVTVDGMVEIAKRPIDPLPGIDEHLMEALLTALNNDPALRPTAARFRDQLAQRPTQSMSRRPLVIAGDSQRDPDRAELSPPQRRRKHAVRLAALATLVLALIAAPTAWLISARAPSRAPAAVTQPAIPTTPSATNKTGARSTAEQVIQLKKTADSAKPFETVRIRGIYHGGSGTVLRLQCWEDNKWLAFPLPTKTDRSGQFTAYVEFGRPGRYRLRLLDPDTGVMSEPLVLAIKG